LFKERPIITQVKT